MEKFLVLGQVPGTDIQITFAMWLNIVVATVGFVAFIWIAAVLIRRGMVIREVSADNSPTTQNPIHATQLHR